MNILISAPAHTGEAGFQENQDEADGLNTGDGPAETEPSDGSRVPPTSVKPKPDGPGVDSCCIIT